MSRAGGSDSLSSYETPKSLEFDPVWSVLKRFETGFDTHRRHFFLSNALVAQLAALRSYEPMAQGSSPCRSSSFIHKWRLDGRVV